MSLIGDRQPLQDLFEQLSETTGGCHFVLAEDIYEAGRPQSVARVRGP
ncbi:hypothetical protein [Dactylosporangium sp. NPDC006015]